MSNCILATDPYLIEVLAYLYEFRVQIHTSLLHPLVTKTLIRITLSASIAQTPVSNPGYVVYTIYGTVSLWYRFSQSASHY